MSSDEMERMFRSGDPDKISRIWASQSWRFRWVSGVILIAILFPALFFLFASQGDDGEPSGLVLRVTIWGIAGAWTLVTWAWLWRRAKVAEGSRNRP
jgi:4-amino-4-deoxy-L-arabinose transferase-like glycosyltransferase